MRHSSAAILLACAAAFTFPLGAQGPAQATEPCLHPDQHPEYRQLDFWVGNWDVVDQTGAKVGMSHVDLILKDCVVFENWTDTTGSSGKSLNKYNPLSGKWEQFWVEDTGVTTYFTGEAQDGEMRYVHERKLKDGRTLMRHMTFSKLPEGKVRQFSQRSLDGGVTWTTEYDYTYVPRKKTLGYNPGNADTPRAPDLG